MHSGNRASQSRVTKFMTSRGIATADKLRVTHKRVGGIPTELSREDVVRSIDGPGRTVVWESDDKKN
jgi:hypothetical protein